MARVFGRPAAGLTFATSISSRYAALAEPRLSSLSGLTSKSPTALATASPSHLGLRHNNGIPLAPPRRLNQEVQGPASCRPCVRYGAGEKSRTPDLRITNALLYQLSYAGVAFGRPEACSRAAHSSRAGSPPTLRQPSAVRGEPLQRVESGPRPGRSLQQRAQLEKQLCGHERVGRSLVTGQAAQPEVIEPFVERARPHARHRDARRAARGRASRCRARARAARSWRARAGVGRTARGTRAAALRRSRFRMRPGRRGGPVRGAARRHRYRAAGCSACRRLPRVGAARPRSCRRSRWSAPHGRPRAPSGALSPRRRSVGRAPDRGRSLRRRPRSSGRRSRRPLPWPVRTADRAAGAASSQVVHLQALTQRPGDAQAVLEDAPVDVVE